MTGSIFGRLRDFWNDGVQLVIHPGAATFASVAQRADLPLAVAGSAAGGFVAGVLFDVFVLEVVAVVLALASTISGLRMESVDPALVAAMVGVALGWLVTMPFISIFNSVVNLFILAGCLYGSAYVMGARGSFLSLTYTLGALFTVASVVSAIMLVIPVAGWVAAMVFGVYLSVPLTNCLRAVFGISAGRASLIWLAPMAAYLLLLLVMALPALVASWAAAPNPGFL